MPGKDTLFERLLVLKKAPIVVQNPPFGRGGTGYRVVRFQGQARVTAAGSGYLRAEAMTEQHCLEPGPSVKLQVEKTTVAQDPRPSKRPDIVRVRTNT